MDDQYSGNAMTEVALALAMAFFSLMILAMVSMSVPRPTDTTGKTSTSKPAVSQLQKLVHLAEPASSSEKSEPTENREQAPQSQRLIIYYGGRFLDQQGKAINPATLKKDESAVLALPPGVSLKEAMEAKAKISTPDLLITTLNKEWLAYLETKQ